MDSCIAIIMYFPRLFLLFIGKQHCLHKTMFGGPTGNEYVFMQNFKFSGVTVLAVQLFNKIKRKKKEKKKKKKKKKEKKKTKNMKKHVSLFFPVVTLKLIYFWWIYSFLYVLDIDVTRNGKNLKLNVKSEFP